MSEAAEKLATGMKAGQAHISGRIESVRQFDARWMHLVRIPAPDPYEMPSTVEITSESRLGSKGDDLAVWVRVSGVPNSFKTRDGDVVKTARNYLVALV